MQRLTRTDLLSLEDYAEQRGSIRDQVLAHKQQRNIHLGPNATLYFEDALTIRYQIQEMLRIEKIFEKAGIEEELAAYNPLIPSGRNLKATFMLEYPEPVHREAALAELVGIESQIWMQVKGYDKVYAIADEDLERATEGKTSAVHFLRFEFNSNMITALVNEHASLGVGSDHACYPFTVTKVEKATRESLAGDFD